MDLDAIGTALAVSEVAGRCRKSPACVLKWINAGVSVPGVGRVKLAAFKLGGDWVVPAGAVEAFVAACNPAAKPPPLSPTQRRRQAEAEQAAAAELLGG